MKRTLSKIALVGALALMATPVFAQNSTVISLTKQGNAGVNDISVLFSAVFNAAVVFAVVFVFGMLILGGYGWITAGGDKAKVEEARTRITNALIGLAIVASAWALINIIGNFFGVSVNSFELPSAAGDGTTTTSGSFSS